MEKMEETGEMSWSQFVSQKEEAHPDKEPE